MTYVTIFVGLMRVSIILSKFLLGAFIAKYMGFGEVATYGLIVGVTAIVQVALRFGIYTHLCRSIAYQAWEISLKRLVNYFSFTIGNYIVILPISLILSNCFHNQRVVLYTFFLLFFEHLTQDIYNLAVSLRFNKTANFLLFLQSSVWIYIYIAWAIIHPSFQNLYSAFNFWITASALTLLISMWITRAWPWNLKLLTIVRGYQVSIRSARKFWKVYASELIAILNMYIDRYILSMYLDMKLVGIYVFFWQISNSINNIIGASVIQVSRSELIRLFKENNVGEAKRLCKRVFLKSNLLTLFLSLIAFFSMPILIQLLHKDELNAYNGVLLGLLMTTYARVAMDNFKLTTFAKHKDFELLIANLIGVSTLFVLSFLFIPILAAYGSIFASILSILFTTLFIIKVNSHKV